MYSTHKMTKTQRPSETDRGAAVLVPLTKCHGVFLIPGMINAAVMRS